MDNKRYRRYFIILDHEDEGFDNKQGKKPKGYTKIEIKGGKGVLSHYIQNMKYFNNAEYIYRGFLVGTKEEQGIFADNGAFVIDENGKGELNWKFDPDNVDGHGNPISDFNVIAIIAEAIDKNRRDHEVHAPLVGFIDKDKVSWKHVLGPRYTRGEKNKPKEEKEMEEQYKKKMEIIQKEIEQYEEEPEEVVPEEEPVEEVEEIKIVEGPVYKKPAVEEIEIDIDIEIGEEKVEKVKGIEPIKVTKPEVYYEEAKEIEEPKEVEAPKEEAVHKKISKEEPKETVVPEKEPEALEEEPAQKNTSYQEPMQTGGTYYNQTEYSKIKQQPYTDHSNYNYYFKMVSDYVNNILKHYTEVEPFEKNIDGCKWWKIDCSQQTLYRNFLPFYGYITDMYYYYNNMGNMMGCSDLIYKYQHYIFGMMQDKNHELTYYLYGIPGRYMLMEQPYAGMTGFVYWHPLEDKNPQHGDYGYWILYVDAKTGNIIMPQKPTPPPR